MTTTAEVSTLPERHRARRSVQPTPAHAKPTARSLLLRGGLPLSQFPIRVLAALSWLFWSSRLFVEIGTFPTAAIWSILFGFGAVILLALYAVVRSERAVAVLDRILVYGTMIIGIIWVVALVYGNPNYGTDEAAFVQGAAQALVHGHNPYGANLSWTLQHFAVAPNSYTYTTTGHLITRLKLPGPVLPARSRTGRHWHLQPGDDLGLCLLSRRLGGHSLCRRSDPVPAIGGAPARVRRLLRLSVIRPYLH